MRGRGRWVAVLAVSLVAIVVAGVVATQVQLDRAVEERCGTTLRPDPRDVIALRASADLIEQGFDGPVTAEMAAAAADQRDRAADLERRCQTRRRVALVGLGAALALAGTAITSSTYVLGYRAGTRSRTDGSGSEGVLRDEADPRIGRAPVERSRR